MKCWILCTLVLVVTLQLSTCSSTLNAQIEDCTKYCLKTKKGSSSQCQLYCEGGFTSPQKTLEIFVDGVPITESMSDSLAQLSLSRVRFDRALFNTPSAFDELVQWTDVLKQQVATAAERVFHPGDGQQFHLLPMPIPLSNEQLNSADFMNRIVDVVPVSNLVYKESSPLMFSEAYKQFLLDVKVDQSNFNTPQSPEVLERIKHLEQVIQNDMNAFLAAGDRCYSGYENHLAAHNLKRISYTFDSYAPSNGDCLQADQHMAAHEAHSRELADYLASINPYDELFRSIASTTSMKQDWETNVDRIRQFANEQIHLENSGQSPSAFHIALDMIRYYLKQEYFGSSVQLEESCLNAHVQFYAKGWTQIPVSPKQWYSQAAIDKYRHMGTNSGTNYFGNGGYLQRQVTQLVVAYKPVLKFTVGKAMKDTFIEQSTMRNFRVLEVGPFVYDRVDFNSNTGTGLVDSYEMVISANNQDAQLIGYKTRSFEPIDVPRVDTSGWAFCRREAACQMNRIPLVAIHRYSRPGRHFLTTNFNELGGGAHGWAYEGVAGHCHGHQHPGTVPIYRYSHRSSAHLYTTNWNELGGGIHGWNYEGVMCYVYPHQAADTIPLHRYSHVRGDRLFTTNWGELGGGGHGWNYEGVACYVHHQSALDQAIGCCKCS